jgi:hypothetical protein
LSATGDLVCQKVLENKAHIDNSRLIRFVAYCTAFAIISHYWYMFLEWLFAGRQSRVASWGKLLVDQLLFDPFATTAFYLVMSLLEGRSWEEAKQKWRQNFWSTQVASWRIWPLAQYINFNYISPQYRVLFGNILGFFWGIYCSWKASH